MKDRIIQGLKILISIILMYLLIGQIDYEEFKSALANVSLLGILVVVLVYLISIVINALKWRVLLREIELGFLVALCFRAQFYATVLPGQLFGEASKVTVWKDRKEDISEVAASVIFDKITGIIGQILIGVFGIYLSSKAEAINNKWILIVIVIAGIFLIYFSTNKHVSKAILKSFMMLGKIDIRLENKLVEFYDSWYLFSTRRVVLVKSILWGIFYQLTGVFSVWFLSMTMGLKINIIEYCWMISLMSVILLLPVSFAGVGLRDASMASMLSLFDVSKGSSLVISMTLLLAQIIAAIIGGIYVLKKNITNKSSYESDTKNGIE